MSHVLERPRLLHRLRRLVARQPHAAALREAARATGAEVWLVGGWVRDAALGLQSRDLDGIVVRRSRALVSHLKRAQGWRGHRVRRRGITTWRFGTAAGSVDLVVAEGRGLRADLERREATLQAIAFDPVRGRLADPLGGLRDLRRGRLRAPGPGAFREDPVRVVRLARLLAQFPSWRATRTTWTRAAEAARELRRAAPERVRDELDRLLAAAAPERGLAALAALGALWVALPELEPLRGCPAGGDRSDTWSHTLEAIAWSTKARRWPGGKALADARAHLGLRWALLLHDVAKPRTLSWSAEGRPRFHGHEILGARMAREILKRLRQRRELVRDVTWLVAAHLRPHHLADAGAPARGLRRLVREAGARLPLLLLHAACDARALGGPADRRRWRRLQGVLRQLEALDEARKRQPLPRLVSGEDVMRLLRLDPGPQVGRVLEEIQELHEEGRLSSREEALAYLERRARAGDGAR